MLRTIKRALRTMQRIINRMTQRSSTNHKLLSKALQQVKSDPENAKAHFHLASILANQGKYNLAYSTLKTAAFLSESTPSSHDLFKQIEPNLSDPLSWNHNQYFRIKTLADKLHELSDDKPSSILDVGGGDGKLAQLLPADWSYCLADPSFNGLTSEHFRNRSGKFDYCVACHVFEHIPSDERYAFLDTLVDLSRQGIILLNPIDIPETRPHELASLFAEVTQTDWAHEHIDCGLPRPCDIAEYANSRDLNVAYEPNGHVWTTAAMVFADHFANNSEQATKIQQFFNTIPFGSIHSADLPNAGLFTLSKSDRDTDLSYSSDN